MLKYIQQATQIESVRSCVKTFSKRTKSIRKFCQFSIVHFISNIFLAANSNYEPSHHDPVCSNPGMQFS